MTALCCRPVDNPSEFGLNTAATGIAARVVDRVAARLAKGKSAAPHSTQVADHISLDWARSECVQQEGSAYFMQQSDFEYKVVWHPRWCMSHMRHSCA